jgi:GntR family transcriptional regulator of arabinose operon
MSSAAVMNDLRKQIQSGKYPSDEPLPPERELAVAFGASRRTVRIAVEQLAAEGLLTIRPKCRPVVASTVQLPVTEERPPDLSVARVSSKKPSVSSRLVALVMWHGIPTESGVTAQQLIFWGMNDALSKAGCHGVFLDLGDAIGSDEENATREAARLQYAIDNEFGGVIFYPYAFRHNRELVREVARRMPIVLIDRMLNGIDADYVGVDNRLAIQTATRHLIDLGHRRLVYITKNESINPVLERQEGFIKAVRDAYGTDTQECILVRPLNNEAPWPLFETLMQLPADQRPTGIVCVNDLEAATIVRRLAKINLSVPEDVSVVGFDNIISTLPNGVGLTTIDQPFGEIGRTAVASLLNRQRDPMSPTAYIELPAQLLIRGSATPPNSP